MLNTCSTDSVAEIDRSIVEKLPVQSIDSTSSEPGFASEKRPYVEPERQKTDAEAVQDWESEGGARTHSKED